MCLGGGGGVRGTSGPLGFHSCSGIDGLFVLLCDAGEAVLAWPCVGHLSTWSELTVSHPKFDLEMRLTTVKELFDEVPNECQ